MLQRIGRILVLSFMLATIASPLFDAAAKVEHSQSVEIAVPAADQPVPPPASRDGREPLHVFPDECEAKFLRGVPRGAIEAALEDPTQVAGWGACANANLPCSFNDLRSTNPPRRMLTLRNPNARYDVWHNTLIFAAGCR